MRLQIEITTDVLHRLEQIAEASRRDVKEQVLYFLEMAVESEWEVHGGEIESILARRKERRREYWQHRPDEAALYHIEVTETEPRVSGAYVQAIKKSAEAWRRRLSAMKNMKGDFMSDNITFYEMDMHAADAETWLLKYPFERQRTIRPHHVQFLAHLMTHHRFREYSVLDVAICGGQKMLVNGYHTLSAIVRSGIPQKLLVIERELPSLNDVARLYTTFDRHLSRTPFDMLQAYGIPEKYAFTKEQNGALLAATKLLLSGFVWDKHGGSPGRIYLNDQEILYTAICDWLPEMALFLDDIAGAQEMLRRGMLRAGTLAVALVTYRFQPGMAEDFWTMVSQDTAPESDHGAKACAYYLVGMTVKQAKGAIRYARTIAQCWNAFVHNRRQGPPRAPDISTPIRIEKTPHDGRDVWRYISESWEVQHTPVQFDEPFFYRFKKPLELGAA